MGPPAPDGLGSSSPALPGVGVDRYNEPGPGYEETPGSLLSAVGSVLEARVLAAVLAAATQLTRRGAASTGVARAAAAARDPTLGGTSARATEEQVVARPGTDLLRPPLLLSCPVETALAPASLVEELPAGLEKLRVLEDRPAGVPAHLHPSNPKDTYQNYH